MKFVELWTDAKNRPAVELVMGTVLGVPTFLYAFGLFGKPEGGVLTALLLFIGGLFGLNTVGNIRNQEQ